MYPARQDINHERKWASQQASRHPTFAHYFEDHHLWNYTPSEQAELRELYERNR